MIRVSILGATGYSGGELIRLLLKHEGVSLQHLTSTSMAGQPVWAAHPDLRSRTSLKFENFHLPSVAKDSDVVFSCLPSAVGIDQSAKLIKAGVKVIDLSADFRLPNAKLFKAVYKKTHTQPALLKKKVYGLPELFRDKIAPASLIANPGCYATAALLSASPLLSEGLVDPKTIVIDAKSGVSGAGKKVAPTHIFCELNEGLSAYGVASHRHQPEIETTLEDFTKKKVQVTFTPHLIPMNRGILSVLYATLKRKAKTSEIKRRFEKFYDQEPFIRVLDEGEFPRTQNVARTNYCDIGVFQDTRMNRLIVIAALDNLIKGAAGQAVQNMNILFNRAETEGLL